MSYLICGLDEVGRGSLAGPLLAVAALFKVQFDPYNEEAFALKKSPIAGIDDSKKLSKKKRDELFPTIIRHPSLVDFGIGEASVDEINTHGIVEANCRVFTRALDGLCGSPDCTIIDGNRIPASLNLHHIFRPKADSLYWPVGAASILAKVIRDSYMAEWDKDFPIYGFKSNAGYGSATHNRAIKNHGVSKLHRTKFVEKLI